MAQPARRRSENVPGDFYVDSTCIDCDTCRWMAPLSFGRVEGLSAVLKQPRDPVARLLAARALVACPTASIGISEPRTREIVREAARSFPVPIDGPVSHCGFHAEASFGATSYFIRRPHGNVLVDSPRFSEPLAQRIAEAGGLRWMVLTHRDDVADHERWARRFGCERVLHASDSQGLEAIERRPEGRDPVELAPDLLFVPVPGHTRGSCVLLFAGRYLFTGDHLAWSVSLGHLYAFRSACWYSWEELTASMRRLRELSFTWVLPGHGRRFHAPRDRMRIELERCITWVEATSAP